MLQIHKNAAKNLPDITCVPEAKADEETKQILLDYCRENIAKYAMPYDISFKDEMPKTLVGKVAYRVLEEEELKSMAEKEQEKEPVLSPQHARHVLEIMCKIPEAIETGKTIALETSF